MKIAKIESLHADAGQRNFDFLKLTTDDGLVGWSEYNDELVTVKPEIVDGYLRLPTGPGWGTEVNEEAVRAHPPQRR